jgi:hypothetical protein
MHCGGSYTVSLIYSERPALSLCHVQASLSIKNRSPSPFGSCRCPSGVTKIFTIKRSISLTSPDCIFTKQPICLVFGSNHYKSVNQGSPEQLLDSSESSASRDIGRLASHQTLRLQNTHDSSYYCDVRSPFTHTFWSTAIAAGHVPRLH